METSPIENLLMSPGYQKAKEDLHKAHFECFVALRALVDSIDSCTAVGLTEVDPLLLLDARDSLASRLKAKNEVFRLAYGCNP